MERARTESETAVCRLVELDLSGWQGLVPFPIDWAPACLGPACSRGWLEFSAGYLPYRRYCLDNDATHVWLFSDGEEMVCLAEVFPPGSAEAGKLLDQLGPAETCGGYPVEAELQRPLRRPGEMLEEHVYGARGLAILCGCLPRQAMRAVRIRGFEPMSAARYHERFVRLPPLTFSV